MGDKKGYFVTFEGPEGGGKTTQAKKLIAKLDSFGYKTLYTREPGGTPTGEAIRNILQHGASQEALAFQTELLLFASSRAQLVNNVIKPQLENGVWVISDRFCDSTIAYQGYGRGMNIEVLEVINRFAIGGRYPDVTFLLDIDPTKGMNRVTARGGQKDTFEKLELEFHKRVREGYLEMAKKESRFAIIDASREVDIVHMQILNELEKRLK